MWALDPFTEIYQRTHEYPMNSLPELKSLRMQNHNNAIFSYLNINSIETGLIILSYPLCCRNQNYFWTAQFSWPGYHKPYHLDILDRWGGPLVYIKSHLPSQCLTNYTTPKNMQMTPFKSKERKVDVYVYLKTSCIKQTMFLRKLIYDCWSLLEHLWQPHNSRRL